MSRNGEQITKEYGHKRKRIKGNSATKGVCVRVWMNYVKNDMTKQEVNSYKTYDIGNEMYLSYIIGISK